MSFCVERVVLELYRYIRTPVAVSSDSPDSFTSSAKTQLCVCTWAFEHCLFFVGCLRRRAAFVCRYRMSVHVSPVPWKSYVCSFRSFCLSWLPGVSLTMSLNILAQETSLFCVFFVSLLSCLFVHPSPKFDSVFYMSSTIRVCSHLIWTPCTSSKKKTHTFIYHVRLFQRHFSRKHNIIRFISMLFFRWTCCGYVLFWSAPRMNVEAVKRA